MQFEAPKQNGKSCMNNTMRDILCRATKKCAVFVSTIKDKRQHQKVLAFVVIFLSVVALVWWVQAIYRESRQHSELEAITENLLLNSTEENIFASSSLPLRLTIPSIQVDAKFETPLGLTPEGAVEVPVAYDTVGWYKYGPTPGEKGPAVIFGHVDTYEGPAVLYSLGQVHEGDKIFIERADGSTVTFAVQGFERVKQNEFPNENVYGNLSYAGIRIVTCSGVFDKKSQHYSHNLIVYGKLLSVEHPER
jgi:sortase (surface protein transpeptidase)